MLSRVLQQQRKLSENASNAPGSTSALAQGSAVQGQLAAKRNTLQPSAIATLNGSFRPPVNPLKRKAGAGPGMAPYQNASQGSGGVLNALHESVYFDENDFVDDCDIDLDESPPSLPQAALAAGKPAPPSPTPQASVSYPVISASQVDWSSSPMEHKVEPLRPDPLQRGSLFTRPSAAAPAAHLAKRRNLPWLSEDSAARPAEPANPNKRQRQVQNDTPTYPTLPEVTPRSKINNDKSFPWNKTASAVKEEQKQHRKQLDLGRKLAQEASGEAADQAPQNENPAQETPSKIRTKSSNKKPARIFLSDEQKRVLELIDQGKKSVFFTGSAGTGKSVLMREIIHVLKRRFARDGDRVAVTASTGLAACNIGGVTLHSFSGIGLGKEPVEQLVRKIKKNSKAKTRWMRTKVLVVDEISMVDGALFDKLEEIARTIRNNGRPFGGIQLVVTGDFFQLPPVPDRGQAAKFSFEAATWSTSIQHTIGLTQVFRQKDPEFASMLNDMRLGKLTDAAIAKFRSLNRPPTAHDEVEATDLFPTRFEVDRANETRMRNLAGATTEFMALDGGSMTDVTRRTELLQNCMAPEKVVLKIGAQVMLIKNIDETLVNGSIGKVTRFMDEATYEYTREFSRGDESADPGDDSVKVRARLKTVMTAINTAQKWPLVEFQLPDGTSRELLCVRESWKIEQPSGEVVASRSQVPLILAWALSIHKAQGQTLDKVRVDLGKIFEKGQAYVALSRATTQEGLQIIRFDPKKVMAHEKVRAFYDSLSSLAVGKKKAAAPAQSTIPGMMVPRDDSLFISDEEEAYASTAL